MVGAAGTITPSALVSSPAPLSAQPPPRHTDHTAYALPGGCAPYPYGVVLLLLVRRRVLSAAYEGDTVVYVTVPDPAGGSTTTTTTIQ
jgi:hypothetical protein